MRCEDCVHEKVCEGFSNCETEGLYEPKRPHGKWIPCSERLSEKDGKYLVTRRSYISKKPEVTTAIFDFTTKEFYPDSNAWMPLPEPYKKEGEKNESDHL